MSQAVDVLGYIHPIAVGQAAQCCAACTMQAAQCCAAWSWSIGATSLARLAIMMMMNHRPPVHNYAGISSFNFALRFSLPARLTLEQIRTCIVFFYFSLSFSTSIFAF